MLKTKRHLLIEAQNEQIDSITAMRLSLLSELNDLAGMGGKDDYKRGLEGIIQASGKDGIALSQLRIVLPDAAKLTDAREALVREEKIAEGGNGKAIVIQPGAKMQMANGAKTETSTETEKAD